MISIIVPVFNKNYCLVNFISICKILDRNKFEVIFIDDGSTDNSLDILHRCCDGELNLHILSQSNMGVSSARNSGIKNISIKSKYIMFFDADDRFDPIKLNCFYDVIVNSKKDLYTFDAIVQGLRGDVCKKLNVNSEYSLADIFVEMYSAALLQPCWNKIYRSEIIKKEDILFDENVSMGEDFRFNLDFIEHAISFFHISEFIYTYIIGNEGSLTGKYHKDSFEYFKFGINRIINFTESKNITYEDVNNRYLYALSDRVRNLLRSNLSHAERINLFLNDFDYAKKVNFNFKKMSAKQKLLYLMLRCGFCRGFYFMVYLSSR